MKKTKIICSIGPSSAKYETFKQSKMTDEEKQAEKEKQMQEQYQKANLTISKYWKNEMNRSNFKILFPYHMNYDDKTIGGVQFTSIDDDFIKIGGFCEVLSGDLYGI